ncbi:TolC family protein, partial [Myxococcota bacterium]|nr:TolC family protein [Myxococcota bacterium]
GDLSTMGDVLGTLTEVVISEHPDRFADFAPYIEDAAAADGEESSGGFDAFVPQKDTLSATFSLVVPVINPAAIPMIRGAWDRYDAMVQRVGYGREQILYGVCKAYFALATMQRMLDVTEGSIDAARAYFKMNAVKAGLHAATQLDVKRAELELTKALTQRAELSAALEKAKAGFRYLTGIEGDFEVVSPELPVAPEGRSPEEWLSMAKESRKDMIAARIEAKVADHGVDGALTGYLPTIDLVGQAKFDNAEEQRFDDDPFSWVVLATLNMNIWDGGIREADVRMKRSQYRQATLAVQDLERQIQNAITSAQQGFKDAQAAEQLAERQLEVARETQKLIQTSQSLGAVTNLEVIDVNTMVFASEANYLAARLNTAMALVDLLSAAGEPVPFG